MSLGCYLVPEMELQTPKVLRLCLLGSCDVSGVFILEEQKCLSSGFGFHCSYQQFLHKTISVMITVCYSSSQNTKSSQNMKQYRLWNVGNIFVISGVILNSLKDHRNLSELNHQSKGLQFDGQSVRCVTRGKDNTGRQKQIKILKD